MFRCRKLDILKRTREEEGAEAAGGECYRAGGGPGLRAETVAGNRARLALRLAGVSELGLVMLEGERLPADTDPFLQEENFFWAFGVLEPGFCGILDLLTGEAYLFYPDHFCLSHRLVSGQPETDRFVRQRFKVDFAFPIESFVPTVGSLRRKQVLMLRCKTKESRCVFETEIPELSKNYEINYEDLFPVISALRAIRNEDELGAIRYATDALCGALMYLLDSVTVGMREYKVQALQADYLAGTGGCRVVSHKTVCVSSSSARRFLHYLRNHSWDSELREGELCVLDLTCSYLGLQTTASLTFPLSGWFSTDQESLYRTVLEVRRLLLGSLEPGVTLKQLNRLAERVLITKLKYDYDLLNQTVEALMEAKVGQVFLPVEPCQRIGPELADSEPLCEGTLVSVGPGCWFLEELLSPALNKGYVRPAVSRYLPLGAVHVKDLVLLTKAGHQVMTSGLPREVEEVVEAVMSARRLQLPYSKFLTSESCVTQKC